MILLATLLISILAFQRIEILDKEAINFFKQGYIDAEPAPFSIYPYGKTITGQIYSLKNELDKSINYKYRCKKLEIGKKLLLVEQSSDCIDENLALIAQQDKVELLIIYFSDYESLQQFYRIQQPIHSHIKIPVLYITKENGFNLENLIFNQGSAQIKIRITQFKQKSDVKIELFQSVTNQATFETYKAIYSLYQDDEIKDKISFEPFMYIDITSSNSEQNQFIPIIDDNTINNQLSNKERIYLDQKSICLYKQMKNETKKYIETIIQFQQECLDTEINFKNIDLCYDELISKRNQVKIQQLYTCIKEEEFVSLVQAFNYQIKQNIYRFPDMFINKDLIDGDITSKKNLNLLVRQHLRIQQKKESIVIERIRELLFFTVIATCLAVFFCSIVQLKRRLKLSQQKSLQDKVSKQILLYYQQNDVENKQEDI